MIITIIFFDVIVFTNGILVVAAIGQVLMLAPG